MNGNNELIFCQAEMMQAIQTYLNEHVFRKEQIIKVKCVKGGSGPYDNTFKIELTDEDK